jgi:hypothetical protein
MILTVRDIFWINSLKYLSLKFREVLKLSTLQHCINTCYAIIKAATKENFREARF